MDNTPDYTKQIWDQLKSLTSSQLLKALTNDPNWTLVPTKGGSEHYFQHNDKPAGQNLVCIHVHPSNTSGYRNFSFLKRILDAIDWPISDLISLKLINKKTSKGKKKKE